MRVDLVDPQKLQRARQLLGTTSIRATLDLALELLLAQSEFMEDDAGAVGAGVHVGTEAAAGDSEESARVGDTYDWE